jgi:tyrosine-protein phosphatase OCA6
VRVAKFGDEVTVTPALISQLLGLLLNSDRHPLLLHCIDGTHISGLVVVCLRKLQNWAAAVYQAEFNRFVQPRGMTGMCP